MPIYQYDPQDKLQWWALQVCLDQLIRPPVKFPAINAPASRMPVAVNLISEKTRGLIKNIIQDALIVNNAELEDEDLTSLTKASDKAWAKAYYLKVHKLWQLWVAQLMASISPTQLKQNLAWAEQAQLRAEKGTSKSPKVSLLEDWQDVEVEHQVVEIQQNGKTIKAARSSGKGGRAYQEDRSGIVANIELDPSWTHRIPELLHIIVLRLQREVIEVINNVPKATVAGSTGTLVFVYEGKAYIVWLGDSPVFLLKTAPNNAGENPAEKIIAQLLIYPHQLTGRNLQKLPEGSAEKAELTRIEAEGGRVKTDGVYAGRIQSKIDESFAEGSGIEPLRGFGDLDVPGMGRIGSITVVELPQDDPNALLVLASDGIESLSPSEIAELWQQYKPDVGNFTEECRKLACRKSYAYSGNNPLLLEYVDNTTVVAIPVAAEKINPSRKTAHGACLFDGHSGNIVVNLIFKIIQQIIREEANKPASQWQLEKVLKKILDTTIKQIVAISEPAMPRYQPYEEEPQQAINAMGNLLSVLKQTPIQQLQLANIQTKVDGLMTTDLLHDKTNNNFHNKVAIFIETLAGVEAILLHAYLTDSATYISRFIADFKIKKLLIGRKYRYDAYDPFYVISLEMCLILALKHYPGLEQCEQKEVLAQIKQIVKNAITGEQPFWLENIYFSSEHYHLLPEYCSTTLSLYESQVEQLSNYYLPEKISFNQKLAKAAQVAEETKEIQLASPVTQEQGSHGSHQDQSSIVNNVTIHPSWDEAIPQLLQLIVLRLQLEISQRKTIPTEYTGSTGTFVFIHNNNAYVLWLGDSPAYLLVKEDGKKAEIEQLTYPHILTEHNLPNKDPTLIAFEKSRITSEEARITKEKGLTVAGELESIGTPTKKVKRVRGFGNLNFAGMGRVGSVNRVKLPESSSNRQVALLLATDEIMQGLKLQEIVENLDNPTDLSKLIEVCRKQSRRGRLISQGIEENEAAIVNATLVAIPVSADNTSTFGFVIEAHGKDGEVLAQFLKHQVEELAITTAAAPKPGSQELSTFLVEFKRQIASFVEKNPLCPLENSFGCGLIERMLLLLENDALMQAQDQEQNSVQAQPQMPKQEVSQAEKLQDEQKWFGQLCFGNFPQLCEIVNEKLYQLSNPYCFKDEDQARAKALSEKFRGFPRWFTPVTIVPQIQGASRSIYLANCFRMCPTSTAQEEYKQLIKKFIDNSEQLWGEKNREACVEAFKLQPKLIEEYFSNYEALKKQGVFTGKEGFEKLPEFKAIIAKRQALALIARKKNSWWQPPDNIKLLNDVEKDIKNNINLIELENCLKKLKNSYIKRGGWSLLDFYNYIRQSLQGHEIKPETVEEAEKLINYIKSPAPAA